MPAHIRGGVGADGGSEQRERGAGILGGDAVFALIYDGYAAALLRQIKPLVVADLKSRLLPARVSVSLSADNARRSATDFRSLLSSTNSF